jgi:hypothetical protein
MKEPVKVVMLLASDQTYQVKKGEYFINDSRENSWGRLELLRAERVTSHGHVWDGDSIKPYIHYLYITVSQPIKEGDWCLIILENQNQLVKVIKIDGINNIYQVELINLNRVNISVFKFEINKIIATTDPKLKLKHYSQFNSCCREESECHCNLPQVSQSFLKEFVANPDGEYEAEYENYYENNRPMNGKRLKLNKDNEVNITSVEENTVSIERTKKYARHQHYLGTQGKEFVEFEDWEYSKIKNNL